MNLLKALAILRKLPPAAIEQVVAFLSRVLTSADPVGAARRAAEEEARVQAFDLAQRKLRR